MRVAGPALDYLSPTFGDGSASPQAEDDEGSEEPDGYHRLKDVRTWGNFRSLVTDPQPADGA